MTTEEDFQRMLDANPNDHQTRMIFADWLEERGDPRAAGYRALGKNRVRSYYLSPYHTYWNSGHYEVEFPHNYPDTTKEASLVSMLPSDWISLVPEMRGWSDTDAHKGSTTRRGIDDAVAHAFSKLPEDRQAELLGHNEPQLLKRKLSRRSAVSQYSKR